MKVFSALLGVVAMASVSTASLAADYGNETHRTMPYAGSIKLGDEWGIEGDETKPPLACDNPKVLRDIAQRFAWAEKNTWHRGFTIAAFQNPAQRAGPYARVSYVPRRYCQATAVMTNGHKRKVYYNIGIELGFASVGNGVSFCLPGLDPWHVYGAHCSTVR